MSTSQNMSDAPRSSRSHNVFLTRPRESKAQAPPPFMTVNLEDLEVSASYPFDIASRLMLCCSAQVKNISNLFRLEPSTIYLVEDAELHVIFTLDYGKFNRNVIVAGLTYEVHGNQLNSNNSQSRPSPFGAYTQPRYHWDPLPPHPPHALGKVKKNIVVVSLSQKEKQKKGKLDYTTVTQVVVPIWPSDCNVPAVTRLVSQQVRFEARAPQGKTRVERMWCEINQRVNYPLK